MIIIVTSFFLFRFLMTMFEEPAQQLIYDKNVLGKIVDCKTLYNGGQTPVGVVPTCDAIGTLTGKEDTNQVEFFIGIAEPSFSSRNEQENIPCEYTATFNIYNYQTQIYEFLYQISRQTGPNPVAPRQPVWTNKWKNVYYNFDDDTLTMQDYLPVKAGTCVTLDGNVFCVRKYFNMSCDYVENGITLFNNTLKSTCIGHEASDSPLFLNAIQVGYSQFTKVDVPITPIISPIVDCTTEDYACPENSKCDFDKKVCVDLVNESIIVTCENIDCPVGYSCIEERLCIKKEVIGCIEKSCPEGFKCDIERNVCLEEEKPKPFKYLIVFSIVVIGIIITTILIIVLRRKERSLLNK